MIKYLSFTFPFGKRVYGTFAGKGATYAPCILGGCRVGIKHETTNRNPDDKAERDCRSA
jgi:hypothetical protein